MRFRRLTLYPEGPRRGMTLLEVLAVCALLSIVSIITIHLMVDNAKRNERRREQIQLVKLLNVALESLTSRLEPALPALDATGTSGIAVENHEVQHEDFVQSKDRLLFSVAEDTEKGVEARQYCCEVEEEEQGTETLYRLLLKPVTAGSSGRPILRLAAGNVLSFDVRAMSGPGQPLQDSWSREDGPPAGVQIRLTSRKPGDQFMAPVILTRTIYFMSAPRLSEGGTGL